MERGNGMSGLPIPLLVTLGDPNGLGPELICRQWADKKLSVAPIVLIGPEEPLIHHGRRQGGRRFWRQISGLEEMQHSPDHSIFLLTPKELDGFPLTMGRAVPAGGFAAGRSLEAACDLLMSGQARGVVTLPLNKAMLQEAGFHFPGHTEFLACRAGLDPADVCMHLCGETLRVSLVTTHPPLRQVPDLITEDRVLRCLVQTCAFVEHFGIRPATVAVCGLNPHAGEGGTIGHEEKEIIRPAIERACAMHLDVVGPLPADTVFYRAAQGEFAAVLAMYHDQGLGPLKLLHFHRAVNVTLGLPFVRTSVDHGTGYDLVGTDRADTGSLTAALNLAVKLTEADGERRVSRS